MANSCDVSQEECEHSIMLRQSHLQHFKTMLALLSGNLHAGLSGLDLQEPSFDLGCGLTLSKTYAHLMAPFLMAFKPAPKGSAVKDDDAHLLPFEVQQRHFPLIVDKSTANPEDIRWLSERWQVTHKLILNSAEFSLAVEAIDSGQFIRQPALALVSLWSSLEALFSPSTAELKFRVSALIAAFLGKVRTSP